MPITPRELFDERVPKGLAANPERVRETPLILQFTVTGSEGGHWTVDTINEPASCTPGIREDAPCHITMSDEALIELLQTDAIGRPQVVMKHVIEGTIEVEGDVTQAMKLSKVFTIADAGG
jgi:hypothetical protein